MLLVEGDQLCTDRRAAQKELRDPPTARLRRCAADTRMDGTPSSANVMPIATLFFHLLSSSHRIDDNTLRDSAFCFAAVSFD